jgi:DNA-binding FadR family transcriptional regulator
MKKLSSPVFTPLNRGKLTDQVISQIKSFIFSQGIKVGEKLPSERELAEQLKISRSVVREALGTLQQSGLIEIRRGRGAGAFVVEHLHKPLLNAAADLMKSGKLDVNQFMEARRAIACFALEQSIDKITEADANKLEEINEELLRNIDDDLKTAENSALFHLTLVQCAGNPLLTIMLQSLLDLMVEIRLQHPELPSFKRRVYETHQAMIRAIRQKDWGACRQLLGVHIDRLKELQVRKKTTT